MPDGPPVRDSRWIHDEHLATRLIALSFDSAASPQFRLSGLDQRAQDAAYGWGFAWYPEQSGAALVVKDPTSVGENAMIKLLREWDRFESTTFLAHLRGAARTLQERDTHPFSRAHGGRDWVFAHNGDLSPSGGTLADSLPLGPVGMHEPIGRTDSEHAFCWLLNQAQQTGARALADIGWDVLHGWFRTINALGTANIVVSDGRDLAVYSDQQSYNPLHLARLTPPNVPVGLQTPDFGIGLDDARERTRTVLVFSTEPLLPEGFERMAPGQLAVARRGAFIFDSDPETSSGRAPVVEGANELNRISFSAAQRPAADQLQSTGESEPQSATPSVAQPAPGSQVPVASAPTPATAPSPAVDLGAEAPPAVVTVPARNYHVQKGVERLLSVSHTTMYRYSKPVERSFHLCRLQPIHDRLQELVEFDCSISVNGRTRAYEDVFGNAVLTADIEQPFSELVIAARSLVRVVGTPRPALLSPNRRFNIPLVWMPWQRQMMTPYLLPPELPETQLRELSDFAMSFVERQDYDLVQTLLDMNTTIYRDFSYVSGSTTMATTPFDVYTARTGVCQDFANLLICMARLLGIPARYRVGYIYTGGKYENEVQSDASHAWAELYLPWTGWRGFDPTNGCLVNADHILVASGRNYGDATPTSGTLYKGGGDEMLTVDVKVEQVLEARPEEPGREPGVPPPSN